MNVFLETFSALPDDEQIIVGTALVILLIDLVAGWLVLFSLWIGGAL